MRNVDLSPDEIVQIFEGLVLREEALKEEIADNEAVDWVESAEQGRRDLAIVQALMARLERL
jgi:hypothetical protein